MVGPLRLRERGEEGRGGGSDVEECVHGRIIPRKGVDAKNAAWQHPIITKHRSFPRDMKTTFTYRLSLRAAAWPSCIAQEGMRLVVKDRPLSGRTTG
jgi:hypothetical protein